MGYTYKSLITDGEIIQGDSSDITLFETDMDTDLSGGVWQARYTIRTDNQTPPIVERSLPLNSEIIDGVPIDGCFVHQILPSESALLTPGTKYLVAIQIVNADLNYSGEVAQFKLKVKEQGVS